MSIYRSFGLAMGLFLSAYVLSAAAQTTPLNSTTSNLPVQPQPLLSAGTGTVSVGTAQAPHVPNASPNWAQTLPWVGTYVEGSPNAPIEVTMYFAPDCHTCAKGFARNHEKLDQNLISKGYLRVKYQEVDLDGVAMQETTILHCLPQSEYITGIKYIIAGEIHDAKNTPVYIPKSLNDFVTTTAKKYGITQQDLNTCMRDKKLEQWGITQSHYALDYLGIRSMPVYVFSNSPYRLRSGARIDDFYRIVRAMWPVQVGQTHP